MTPDAVHGGVMRDGGWKTRRNNRKKNNPRERFSPAHDFVSPGALAVGSWQMELLQEFPDLSSRSIEEESVEASYCRSK